MGRRDPVNLESNNQLQLLNLSSQHMQYPFTLTQKGEYQTWWW